jgi:hypothetical protein
MDDIKINSENVLLTINKLGTISIIDNTTGEIWKSTSLGVGVSTFNKSGKLINLDGVNIIECKAKQSGVLLTTAITDTTDVIQSVADFSVLQNLRINLEIDITPKHISFKVCAVNGLKKGQIIGIDFPAGLGAAKANDDGYLVMPCGVGVMCDFSSLRNSLRFERLIYSGGQVGYSMPLFGIVKGNNALAGIVKTPFDCILRAWINDGENGEYSITPCWIFEEGRLDYAREINYYMLEKSGYVEIAKTYKNYLIAESRYKTFREKVDESPVAANLAGASLAERFAHLSENRMSKNSRRSNVTIREIYDKANKVGLDRVVSYFLGVWQRAYFKDCISPEYGTIEELKAVADYARSLSEGYIVSVYENLLDLFKTNPNWNEKILVKNRDGSLRTNWYVESEGAWTHTVCPSERINIAREELPKLKEIIGEGSIYMDVEGAMGLMECFEPNHPITREDDCRYRRKLLAITKKIFGSVVTEAVPIDCLADVVDVGAYFPIYQFIGEGPWCSYETRLWPPVFPIPLFQLVFHGSVINMNPSKGGYYAGHPPYTPLYGMLPDTIDEFALRISHEMRDNVYHDMLEHRFLTEPCIEVTDKGFCSRDVQMSRFSDGTVVISNFSKEVYTHMGKKIPAEDFIIIKE